MTKRIDPNISNREVFTLTNCPIQPVVDIISGKWTSLILWEISKGNNHYGSLQRTLKGISTRTLSSRLRMLENEGIVKRIVTSTIPPTVEYLPTEKGLSMAPILYAMKDWSKEHNYS